MSQFKIHTTETAPKGSKELLEESEKQLGFIPNLYGIMAEAPAALKSYNELNTYFESTSFTNTEKQLILLTVSYVNGCNYCMAVHTTVSQMLGLDQSVVEAVRKGEPITEPKLEALRKFVQTVVEKRGWLEESEVDSFLSAGYSHAKLLEAVVGIAQKTLSNYINHIVKTPLDSAFEPNKWEKESV